MWRWRHVPTVIKTKGNEIGETCSMRCTDKTAWQSEVRLYEMKMSLDKSSWISNRSWKSACECNCWNKPAQGEAISNKARHPQRNSDFPDQLTTVHFPRSTPHYRNALLSYWNVAHVRAAPGDGATNHINRRVTKLRERVTEGAVNRILRTATQLSPRILIFIDNILSLIKGKLGYFPTKFNLR